MAAYSVGYFVGSLATKSINRLLAKALVRVAPPELDMTEIAFRDLPLYSYDYDAKYPAVATEFKDAIAAVDAVLFVTPEYNRAIAQQHLRAILAFCNSPLIFDRGVHPAAAPRVSGRTEHRADR